MEQLKPCPFCNGEATITLYIKQIAISCKNCSAVIIEKTAQEAIEAWNKESRQWTEYLNQNADTVQGT